MPVYNGTSGADTLTGSTSGDEFYALGGNDSISASGGNDTIDGGAGADTIDGGAGIDYVTFSSASAGVAASVTNSTGAGSGTAGDAAGDSYTTIEGLIGSAYNDTLGGTGFSSGSLLLQGGAGDDVYSLDGNGTGSITVVEGIGGGTDEMRTATRPSLTLAANVENLTNLGSGPFTGTGNALDNVLTGGSGADILRGGAGADTLNGGGGTDVASYLGSATGVIVNLATGSGTGDASGDVFISIEGLEGSSSGDALTGNSGANTLSGQGGNDTLEGGAGADTFDGGIGSDLVSYAGAGAGVAASLTGSTGTGSGTVGDASGDVLSTVEGLIGSAYNDTLGAVGATSGSQTLQGGAGDDVYDLNGNGTGSVTVVELSGQGADTMRTATRPTMTLAANVENLINTGAGAFTGIGNDLNNSMTGGSGIDILRGAGGADTLNGGGGNDVASYLGSVTGVTANLATGVGAGDAAGDVYISIEGLEGSSSGDHLTGDSGASSLSGQGGNDTLEGGAGADTIDGGIGSDLVSYAGAGAAVVATITGGTGSGSGSVGDAAGDVFTTIEGFIGSMFNDTLSAVGATSGTQTLQGGAGNDIYSLDGNGTGSVTVVENVGEGVDEMRTWTRSTLTLTANVENLTNLGSGSFTGTGNNLANVLNGGSGADILRGGDGADTITGGGGTDLASYLDSPTGVTVSLASAVGTGFAAGDVFNSIEGLEGSNAGDVLIGDTNNNAIYGQGGDDILEGGLGSDTLTGGSGIDAASYLNSAAAVSINLATATFSGGDAAGDQLSGIEVLIGSASADTLAGGNLDDILVGDAGADSLVGGSGNDVIGYLTSESAVAIDLSAGTASGGDAAGDTYSGVEGVYGSSFNDAISGDGGNNRLEGGWGSDTISGGGGNDVIWGYHSTSLASPVAPSTTVQNDVLHGEGGNDTIVSYGQDVNALVYGDDGNDVIQVGSANGYGGAGDDTITSTQNEYSLFGGDGADRLNLGGWSTSPSSTAGYAEGGDGGDSYYMQSSGNVYISETGATGTDHLYFLNAVVADIVYFQSGDDLVITTAADIADSSVDSAVILIDWYLGAAYQTIEQFHASDGSFII